MGWLCRHCLYERREKPRRRDVLLRFFHHLFAGNAVDLNAFECEVLLAWLTEDTAFAASAPWRKDPLETTLARLRTSAAEGKAATALAVTTARTIIAVLRETPVTSTDSPCRKRSAVRHRPAPGRMGSQPSGPGCPEIRGRPLTAARP